MSGQVFAALGSVLFVCPSTLLERVPNIVHVHFSKLKNVNSKNPFFSHPLVIFTVGFLVEIWTVCMYFFF